MQTYLSIFCIAYFTQGWGNLESPKIYQSTYNACFRTAKEKWNSYWYVLFKNYPNQLFGLALSCL